MTVNNNDSELESRWCAGSAGPIGEGRVMLLVLRASPADMPKGQDKISQPMHQQPTSIRFTVEDGVEGDRWQSGKNPGKQISLTSLAVTKLVAGDKERWHLLGDNLVVDLDMSAGALAVGTKLRLGTGLIQISDVPHDPCERYRVRLGEAVHTWVSDEKHASRHLRGRYAQILVGGEVAIGEAITVVPG